MESNFMRFLEFVPYTDYNAKVYSPKLLAILLQTCGYIDTIFKEMAKFQEFADIPECQAINVLEPNKYEGFHIGLARNAFERIYKLSSNNGARIIAKLDWVGDKELKPFAKFSEGKSPDWWRYYQDVKHTWSTAIEKANMDNTLEALAGAFLLNAVHYPSMKILWKLGYLKTVIKVGKGYADSHVKERHFDILLKEAIQELKPLSYSLIMETPLFIYAHRI